MPARIVTSRPGIVGQKPGSVTTGTAETSSRWAVLEARAAAQPVAKSQSRT